MQSAFDVAILVVVKIKVCNYNNDFIISIHTVSLMRIFFLKGGGKEKHSILGLWFTVF